MLVVVYNTTVAIMALPMSVFILFVVLRSFYIVAVAGSLAALNYQLQICTSSPNVHVIFHLISYAN